MSQKMPCVGRAAALPALLLLMFHFSAGAILPTGILKPAGSRRSGSRLPGARNLGLRGGIFATTSQEKMKSGSEAAENKEAVVEEVGHTAKPAPTPGAVVVSSCPSVGRMRTPRRLVRFSWGIATKVFHFHLGSNVSGGIERAVFPWHKSGGSTRANSSTFEGGGPMSVDQRLDSPSSAIPDVEKSHPKGGGA